MGLRTAAMFEKHGCEAWLKVSLARLTKNLTLAGVANYFGVDITNRLPELAR
jgi:hypothetical protein